MTSPFPAKSFRNRSVASLKVQEMLTFFKDIGMAYFWQRRFQTNPDDQELPRPLRAKHASV